MEVETEAFGFLAAVAGGLGGDVGQIERLPLLDAAFAAGQGEQRLDKTFLLVPEG